MLPYALLVLLSAQAAGLKGKIATIDFFGIEGDLPAGLSGRVPVHVGDALPTTGAWYYELQQSVKQATGATEVSLICCDPSGGWNIFIGMSRREAPKFRESPAGPARLPEDALQSYRDFIRVLPKGLERGGSKEDRSKGYALSSDDELRATQLRMREAALKHGGIVLEVLDTSADKQHRGAAAHLAGYAAQSKSQIDSLVRALDDSDSTVRNNATRALACLVESDVALGRHVPAALIVDRLNSPVWSDRNKAVMMLIRLTVNRDAAVLAELRAHGLGAVKEMANWHSSAHAAQAAILLERLGETGGR